MANVGQSTFIGGVIIIECDENWTCCQREQAKNKVDGYNKEIKEHGPLEIISVTAADEQVKEACQKSAGSKLKRKIKKGPEEAQKAAKEAGAPDCLADEIKEKVEKKGAKNLEDCGIQMDHPVEVRFGGPANTDLIPLDREVNNAFGGMAKNTGNDMLAAGETEIKAIALYCPPSGKCPDKDHSNAPPHSISEPILEEPGEMILRGKR